MNRNGWLKVAADLRIPEAATGHSRQRRQRDLALGSGRHPALRKRSQPRITPMRRARRLDRVNAKNERRRDRRISEAEEQRLLDATALLKEPPRGNAKLSEDAVREIRARAHAGVHQSEVAARFNISQSLGNEILRGHIWDPASKLTTGDEMRDRIIGALDTGCRRGEMMKIQNKHVDWQNRRIRILKEHSKGGSRAGDSIRAGQSP